MGGWLDLVTCDVIRHLTVQRSRLRQTGDVGFKWWVGGEERMQQMRTIFDQCGTEESVLSGNAFRGHVEFGSKQHQDEELQDVRGK